MGRQANRIADKILHGTKATRIPATPAECCLAINLKTAHTLGIEVRNESYGKRILSNGEMLQKQDIDTITWH